MHVIMYMYMYMQTDVALVYMYLHVYVCVYIVAYNVTMLKLDNYFFTSLKQTFVRKYKVNNQEIVKISMPKCTQTMSCLLEY